MRNLSIWTMTLAAGACLATGAWAQHGSGVHGGAGHDADFDGASHSSAGQSTHGTGATSFDNRVINNTKLSSRLKPLLPAGSNLQTAASGFKNEGQFIAALHVSRNLNIPWDQLKAEMTGTKPDSLGGAIHELRPDLDTKLVKNNVKLAENQTKTDIEESNEKKEAAGK